MGYCFMTIEKIKNTKQLVAKYKHNFREIEVSNADKDKKDLNEELVSLNGSTYKEAFEKRTAELGYGTDKKIRSNAVYAFEVVTTFSRDQDIDLDKWKENNVKWLRETFNANPEKYGDNVLSVVYHADEPGNVHCHAIVIPVDDKGNLNARYYVRSRQKMVELQDSYGKLMKEEHNLDRGIHGSKARHQDIKRYYAALNQILEKELPDFKEHESLMEYRARANEIYKDACLQIMGLEDKNKRLEMEKEQIAKNEVSAAKKELIHKYKDKADHFDELVRDHGDFPEMKDKLEKYDDLIEGIRNSEQKEDFITIVDSLIQDGDRINEKKRKNIQKSL